MIGEFGGIGAFQEGHMWTPKGCHTYLVRPTCAVASRAQSIQAQR